jgi:D-3-phosphoglycerate dehydrogenase
MPTPVSRVLVTCGHLQRHIGRYEQGLRDQGIDVFVPPLTAQQFSAAEMIEHIKDIDVVIAGDDFITAEVLDAGKASRLKAIVKWGIGTDSIDKPAATARGIPVYNTPGMFSDEVADLALSYVLALARSSLRVDSAVRSGQWLRVEGTSLRGKTAGVVGLGGIGQAIAVRCRAFGMTVVGSDVAAMPEAVLRACGAEQLALEEVLGKSDFLILACNLTAENRHLINANTLGLMKAGAFIVNVARGPLVDEAALIEALKSQRLAGAGLDVFEVEPLPGDSPLRDLPNCVFGTHGGSSTREAIIRVNELTLEMAKRILLDANDEIRRFNRVA